MSGNAPVQHGPVAASASAPSAAAAKREELMAEVCGLGATMSAAMAAQPGFVPCGHAFSNLLEGLFAATACDDAAELDEVIDGVRARSEHIAAHRGVPQGVPGLAPVDAPDSALLLAAVRGIAADAVAAMQLGRMDDEVDALLADACRALGAGTVDHGLLVRAAAAAQKARELAR